MFQLSQVKIIGKLLLRIPENHTMNKLTITNLSKTYPNGVKALDNVS
ncbi:MAG: hypothetical protein ACI97X_001516, partial [Oceanospirillaceae bacterium]